MAKYSKRIKDRIVELIEADAYTVSEICDFAGISRKTFYEWKNTIPEFSEAIDEARERCDEALVAKAHHALHLKLNGYKATTTTYKYVPNEYGELQLKEKTVKTRECPPDIKTIMQVLERVDKKKEQQVETSKGVQPIVLTVSTEEECVKYQPMVDQFVRNERQKVINYEPEVENSQLTTRNL